MKQTECIHCGRTWPGLSLLVPSHDCYVRIRREEWEAVLARLAAVEGVTYRDYRSGGLP